MAVVCGLAAVPVSAGAPAAKERASAAAVPTRIMCANHGGTRYVSRRKPRTCTAFGPGGTFGGGVNLHRLHWRAWGHSVARARGYEYGFHLPYSKIKVKVKAYRLRHACGRRVCTRLKARSRYGTTVVRVARCPGPAY